MSVLTDLPVELLSRIVAAVDDADGADNETHDGQHQNLESLRRVCKIISQICTPRLFRSVRVLPIPESAARFMKILESDRLNPCVNRVVFQTRMDPTLDGVDSEEEYTEPEDFFLEAMERVGLFRNLRSASLIFSEGCSGGDDDCGFNDHLPEQIEFREPVLEKFFAGLNHKDHPATGVVALSIKNLQDKTPAALTGTQKNKFKNNFQKVMSRITHLSLQIATEYDQAAPEHTLEIQEAHEFFNEELSEYWLEPVSDNLTYLKLYATEMYWGYFPWCHLPSFQKLRTIILGNMTFTHDEQLQWIFANGEKLQNLVLDDCPIIVGAHACEHAFYPDRAIHRGEPPVCIDGKWPMWKYEARWHNYFDKIRNGLPELRSFAYGSGPWDQHTAFDEADSLTSSLPMARYMFYDGGAGPSPWTDSSTHDGERLYAADYEEDDVYMPKCDDEDQRALDELLNELRLRH